MKMMKTNSLNLILRASIILVTIVFCSSCGRNRPDDLLNADNDISLSSSDTFLVNVFNWARKTSDSFVGSDNDPVGPWYEAALPNREAFCIRDVSHQCIGTEILGHRRQNLNIFRKFVGNISEKKDYCSFWEINRYNKPAPVDYLSDNDFWYNLNANFDIIDACYKMFQWTGDSTFIYDREFDTFFQITLNQYIDRWQLQPDKIMDRPAFMNLRPETIKYKFARGIPSYDESQDDMTVSGDLLGMIYNGFRVYSQILKIRGQEEQGKQYISRAEKYLHLIDSLWWDELSGTYHAFYKTDKKFYRGGVSNSEFLLWYNVVEDSARIRKSLFDISNSQVEVLSYLPMLFYRYGFNNEGYDFLGRIYADKRRNYPEASSSAIEGIVHGLMGVEPSASDGMIKTCPRLTQKTAFVTVENIPVFCGLISLRHESQTHTTLANKSERQVTWRAIFQGYFENIKVNGKKVPANHFSDAAGRMHSYTDITVAGKSQEEAEASE
jgi:hypothetical protein